MSDYKKCQTYTNQKCLDSNFCQKYSCMQSTPLRSLFKDAPIGFAFVSKFGQFLSVNEYYANILGYTVEELVNLRFIDITHPEDIGSDVSQAMDVAEGKISSYDMKKRYIKKNGEFIWVHMYVVGIYEDNKFQYYTVYVRDITEEKVTLLQLKEKNTLYEFATQAGHIGIWEWNENNTELIWDNQMFDIYELDRNIKPTYSKWCECLIEEDLSRVNYEVQKSLMTGEMFDTTFKIKVKNKIKHIKARAEVIGKSPNKKMIGSNIDITDIATAQEKLKQKNKDLEQFAYIASHDLQQPLRVVSQFLQIFDREYGASLDEEARKYIKKSIDGTRNMKYLIDSILKLSSSSSTELNFKDISLNEVIDEVSMLFETEEDPLNWLVVDNLPTIWADRVQIMLVFQNLISNSIKFKRDGTPLQISIKQQKSLKNEVIIRYKDNGIGIEPRQEKEIFNLFARINTKIKGSGIGLAICKKILDRHNAEIYAKSEPEGLSFYIKFNQPYNNNSTIEDFNLKQGK